MIKSTELRIGNWVKDDKDRIGSVHLMTMLNGVYTLHLLPYLSSNHFHKKLSQLKPIPLSEEILLKAGFKKHGKVVSYLSLNTGLSDGYDDVEALLNWSDFTEKNEGELLFVFEGKGRWINISHIKYLHQLQNLFHALTNTELTINL